MVADRILPEMADQVADLGASLFGLQKVVQSRIALRDACIFPSVLKKKKRRRRTSKSRG